MSKNWAIVIGINHYEHLQSLDFASRDAQRMGDFLKQELDFNKLFLFTDDSPAIGGKSTRPTLTNLLKVLDEVFAQPFMAAGDNFWFFFSGHGIPHNGRDYLMPADGYPSNVERTAIAVDDIRDKLRRCGADNVIMILDACRKSSTKTGEGIGRQTAAAARQTGVISLFSCNPNQYSYEITELQQGAFTYALLEGLGIRGQCATVERLNQYLSQRVPELVWQHKQDHQTPYTIIEPITKSHLILNRRHATLAEIAVLKNDAYQAEIHQDYTLAEQLWIRILAAASGQDMDAIAAFKRLAQPPTSQAPPSPSNAAQPKVAPPPAAKLSAAIPTKGMPIVSPPSNPSKSSRSQQQNQAQRSRPSGLTRKKFLQVAGWGGAGVMAAALGSQFSNKQPATNSSPSPPPSPSPTITPKPNSTPKPSSINSPANPSPSPPQSNLQTFRFEVVTVNDRGTITQRQPGQASYYREDLGNSISLDMVVIRVGSFQMGSPANEAGRYSSESPQHPVTMPDFFMGKYPVTQAQYQAIMGKNPSNFKGDKHPVETVSWNNAMEFCQKLSQKTDKDYRLPSEAEWEYACRAGTTTPFHFGATITPYLVNYNGKHPYGNAAKGKYREQTTEVGSFPYPNAFGLYDLHGNVWEWCADNWHNNYQGAPTNGSIWKTSDFNNDPHVLRGGSWNDYAVRCRTANRSGNDFVRFSHLIGFRVVCGSGART